MLNSPLSKYLYNLNKKGKLLLEKHLYTFIFFIYFAHGAL